MAAFKRKYKGVAQMARKTLKIHKPFHDVGKVSSSAGLPDHFSPKDVRAYVDASWLMSLQEDVPSPLSQLSLTAQIEWRGSSLTAKDDGTKDIRRWGPE